MSIHEECGVFGIISPKSENLAHTVYYGLFALQHRGQEGCGIVVNDNGVFHSHKDLGLVEEVFSRETLANFPHGTMAVGHARYGTTGGNERINCQPIEVNHLKGNLAVAHNGNLTNSFELKKQLELTGAIFHTTSDTETIAYIITKERLTEDTIVGAVSKAMDKLEGSYSLVLMNKDKLIAVRDPFGFRPLCYGQMADGAYVVASESCALESVGATFVRDLLPGEIIQFDKDGLTSYKDHCGKQKRAICIFEYIYFSRPDSIIDGVSVHEARIKAGKILAQTHPVDADVVIGVPDSGLDAAVGYSIESGLPYEIGLIKNKYIGRTFIAPTQNERTDLVKIKLNAIKSVINGKRIVLIDDSMVRGTTSQRLVKLLKEAGAKEIHMRITAPPFLYPCYYGTDIDSQENLIACHHSIEEIAKIIGVTSLAFLPLDKLNLLIDSDNFCAACFDGKYFTNITPNVQKNCLERNGGKINV